LYDIEDRCRAWLPEARRQLRVAESIPLLDKMGAYLVDLARTILPKSSMAKAVTFGIRMPSRSGAPTAVTSIAT